MQRCYYITFRSIIECLNSLLQRDTKCGKNIVLYMILCLPTSNFEFTINALEEI